MLEPFELKVRVRANAAVAIRSDEGAQFGVLRVLEGDRAVVELPTELPLGAAASMRVELGVLLGSCLWQITAGRLLPTASDEQPRQLMLLVEPAASDLERWMHWRRSLIDGGTFTDFSGITESHTGGGEGTSPRQQTAGALRAHRSGVGEPSAPRPVDDPIFADERTIEFDTSESTPPKG